MSETMEEGASHAESQSWQGKVAIPVSLPCDHQYWPHVKAQLVWLRDQPPSTPSLLLRRLAHLERIVIATVRASPCGPRIGSAELGSLVKVPPFDPHQIVKRSYFLGLAVFLDEVASADERERFLGSTLPFIADKAIEMERLRPARCLTYLMQNMEEEVELSRSFIASLVACIFLGVMPEPPSKEQRTKLNDLDFSRFFPQLIRNRTGQVGKLRCILHYFHTLHLQEERLAMATWTTSTSASSRSSSCSAAIVTAPTPVHQEISADDVADGHSPPPRKFQFPMPEESPLDRGLLTSREGNKTRSGSWPGVIGDAAGEHKISNDNLTSVYHPQVLRVQRRVLSGTDQLTGGHLLTLDSPLCYLHVDTSGRLHDADPRLMRVDFANSYVGGGILGSGCVQEEIEFSIHPELLSVLTFTECLEDVEALWLEGHTQYSLPGGYGSSFHWRGSAINKPLPNRQGRNKSPDEQRFNTTTNRSPRICAIDALPFHLCPDEQYIERNILREINKAFVGFRQHDAIEEIVDEQSYFQQSDTYKNEAFQRFQQYIDDITGAAVEDGLMESTFFNNQHARHSRPDFDMMPFHPSPSPRGSSQWSSQHHDSLASLSSSNPSVGQHQSATAAYAQYQQSGCLRRGSSTLSGSQQQLPSAQSQQQTVATSSVSSWHHAPPLHHHHHSYHPYQSRGSIARPSLTPSMSSASAGSGSRRFSASTRSDSLQIPFGLSGTSSRRSSGAFSRRSWDLASSSSSSSGCCAACGAMFLPLAMAHGNQYLVPMGANSNLAPGTTAAPGCSTGGVGGGLMIMSVGLSQSGSGGGVPPQLSLATGGAGPRGSDVGLEGGLTGQHHATIFEEIEDCTDSVPGTPSQRSSRSSQPFNLQAYSTPHSVPPGTKFHQLTRGSISSESTATNPTGANTSICSSVSSTSSPKPPLTRQVRIGSGDVGKDASSIARGSLSGQSTDLLASQKPAVAAALPPRSGPVLGTRLEKMLVPLLVSVPDASTRVQIAALLQAPISDSKKWSLSRDLSPNRCLLSEAGVGSQLLFSSGTCPRRQHHRRKHHFKRRNSSPLLRTIHQFQSSNQVVQRSNVTDDDGPAHHETISLVLKEGLPQPRRRLSMPCHLRCLRHLMPLTDNAKMTWGQLPVDMIECVTDPLVDKMDSSQFVVDKMADVNTYVSKYRIPTISMEEPPIADREDDHNIEEIESHSFSISDHFSTQSVSRAESSNDEDDVTVEFKVTERASISLTRWCDSVAKDVIRRSLHRVREMSDARAVAGSVSSWIVSDALIQTTDRVAKSKWCHSWANDLLEQVTSQGITRAALLFDWASSLSGQIVGEALLDIRGLLRSSRGLKLGDQTHQRKIYNNTPAWQIEISLDRPSSPDILPSPQSKMWPSILSPLVHLADSLLADIFADLDDAVTEESNRQAADHEAMAVEVADLDDYAALLASRCLMNGISEAARRRHSDGTSTNGYNSPIRQHSRDYSIRQRSHDKNGFDRISPSRIRGSEQGARRSGESRLDKRQANNGRRQAARETRPSMEGDADEVNRREREFTERFAESLSTDIMVDVILTLHSKKAYLPQMPPIQPLICPRCSSRTPPPLFPSPILPPRTHVNRLGVATGNWGCGAFKGDPQIKALIQWIAGSVAGLPVILYFTAGDKRVAQLEELSRVMVNRGWSVRHLYSALYDYSLYHHHYLMHRSQSQHATLSSQSHKPDQRHGDKILSVFDFVMHKLL